MELETASREELIALIREQQEMIARQAASIGQLEARIRALEVSSKKPKGMPGNKIEPKKLEKPKTERKRREQHFTRKRSEPHERVVHAYDTCPECGTGLTGGSIKRTREVIEIRPSPVVVTEHVYLERICPCCESRYTPKTELPGVVGKSRMGVGLMSLIATLREEGRLPIRTIRWYLETFHGLTLSVGAIVGVLKKAAQIGQAQVAQILEAVRGSPVVNADETGWRQDGHNGYVWTYSTPTERYFIRAGRDHEVVEQVLGPDFGGVLGSDFYASYNVYLGEHQRCWTHLLRDIHELRELHPEDEQLSQWAKRVHKLYQRAKDWVDEHPDVKPSTRLKARWYLEEQLLGLCRPYLDSQTPQAKLSRRIDRYIKELFVFVSEPGVPSDNNSAERSLRPLVTSRKISGGTRSEAGTNTKMSLSTLFGTWRARGLNPYHACLDLLQSPQP